MMKFFKVAIFYTFIVIFCIVIYAYIYAVKINQPVSLGLIIDTMGFGIGSGPSNNGYAILVEWKWIISYVLYALLGAAPIIAGMISNVKYNLLKENKDIFWLSILLIIVLIYISARHSTYIYYNAGGKMMNLCGRYVAYTTPLLAICWFRTCDLSERYILKVARKIYAGITGIVIVWGAYELLYVFSPGVEQSSGWLTGIRAADNAGFTNLGIVFCWMYCVGIWVLICTERIIGILIICILLSINSFSAVLTCEKYHSAAFVYSELMKELCDREGNGTISVLCTEFADYDRMYQFKWFYNIDGKTERIRIVRAPIELIDPCRLEQKCDEYLFLIKTELVDSEIYQKNIDLITGDLNKEYVLLEWDKNRFYRDESKLDVLFTEENQVRLSCEGNNQLMFICGRYLLPVEYEAEGNQVFVAVDKKYFEDDIVCAYDLSELSLREVVLER
ncbi:MAG: hypothetical protein HFI10_03955 [Lachnospiraceae bacterium]|nr:hypothetical protein [Lachnospiraceae bacterium]